MKKVFEFQSQAQLQRRQLATMLLSSLPALQSLGVSKDLKEAGYALLCVAYPKGNAVVQTVEEDEVYNKQFGNAFAERALKPGDRGSIERDDFALEIANMDE